MNRAVVNALIWGLVALASPAATRADMPKRFAIVIGNNASDRASTPRLQYADDDAIAIRDLLREAGVRTWLLVRPDANTARLVPKLRRAGPPRAASLRRAMAELRAAIGRTRGATEFLLFYSGHGDVDHGEGYVLLEDLRLTRSLLREEVIEKTRATRNHVVIDACKSYFVAFEKGPGGSRRAYVGAWAPETNSAPNNTGYVLSTASDRDSHEWSRYQAGIFSYEVRSALRGAADANTDGSVTYAELGAFLRSANRSISNARYRPEFVVRPPRDALGLELLRWPKRAELRFDRPELGHVYLEGAEGERIADWHVAPDEAREIHLPTKRPLFLRKANESVEYSLGADPRHILTRLSPEPVHVARRGALHLAFGRLFSVPFRNADVAAFTRHYGEKQVERSFVLASRNRRKRAVRTFAATTGAGAAVALAAATASLVFHGRAREGSQVERAEANDKLKISNALLFAGAGVGVAGAIGWLTARLWPDPHRAKLRITPTASSRRGGIHLGRSW